MLAGILQHYPRDHNSSTDPAADDDHSLSYSESTMEDNEEEVVEEDYYSSSHSSIEPSMIWACILRNGTLLAKATAEDKGPAVVGLARSLLRRKVTTGWDTCVSSSSPTNGSLMSTLRGGYKGLKFHVLEEEHDNKILVWTFACVYDSRFLQKEMAQAFVEQKLVAMTEGFRQMDDTWKFGGHLACQEVFGPILRQRLDEMSYRSDVASVDDGLVLSQETINNNVAILKRRQERIRKIKKKLEKMDKLEELDRSGHASATVPKRSAQTNTFLFSGWKDKITHSRNQSVDTTVDITEGESSEEGDTHREKEPVITPSNLKTTGKFKGGERGVVDIASIVEDEIIKKYTDDPSTTSDEDVEEILRLLGTISTGNTRPDRKKDKNVRVGWKDQVPDKVVSEVQTSLVASDEVSILTEVREIRDEKPCFLCNICFWRKKPSNLVE